MVGSTFDDMTQQGVRWTADQVLALAPDAASRKAGSKLGAAGPWSEAGSSDEGTVWGLCAGSGSKPYQTVIDVADSTGPAYKCSCPSRKFPCKHALGLLLLWAGEEGTVPRGQAPDWAEQWTEGRRQRAEEKATTTGGASGTASPGDPEAARRRAERRAERITAGATELEQRLADLLRGGLAGAEQAGYGMWEETAARMVDAQAPGLAARVRELGAIPSSGPGWPVRLLEECALLHLLDQGWLRRERLPDDLATTVRSRIGLHGSADGPPVRDSWLVLAQYDTSDSRLTTRRIWLHGSESGRTALLLSYGAACSRTGTDTARRAVLRGGTLRTLGRRTTSGTGRTVHTTDPHGNTTTGSHDPPGGGPLRQGTTRRPLARLLPRHPRPGHTDPRRRSNHDTTTLATGRCRRRLGPPHRPLTALPPRPVAPRRPLRRRPRNRLRRVRPPRLHSADGLAGRPGRSGAAVLLTTSVQKGRRHS